MNTSNSSNHLSLIHPNTVEDNIVEDMIPEDYNSGEDTLNDAFQKSLTSLKNIDKELDKLKDFIIKDLSSCLIGSNINPIEPQGPPILEKDYEPLTTNLLNQDEE